MTEQKTVAFHTLGCKVNQYDTQAMRERFEQAGYRTAEFDGQADIYVVNTCTVTGTGDKKSMQIIRRCHRQNPQAQIVVTGCLAQRAADELTLPGVRLVLGTQRRGEIAELLRRALAEKVGDATVIIVAQRISTILHADQIIVLDEGKLSDMGTHDELIKTCEVYQQIALSQLSKEELA